MAADITRWCRDCQQCQRGKVTVQARAAVQPIPIPPQRFQHVHVDIVGPLPASTEGYVYLLTMIDRTTRWLEAAPMKNMDAVTCANTLVATWIARYGVPALLTSDRGTQFASAVWQILCNKLGIQQIFTTAYHPQSNGMIERAHRQIKDSLRSRLAGNQWPEHLPWVLLGLRAAPKEDTSTSSAELVFGSPLVLPGQLLTAAERPVSEFVRKLRDTSPLAARPLTYAQAAAAVPKSLMAASYVYVRRGGTTPPLTPLYQGPFLVKQSGPKFFKLLIGSREESVSVDRLKPHLGEAPVSPAAPRQRGRPRVVLASTSSTAVSSAALSAASSTGGGPL
jgi:transposase InsO family protein